MITGARDAGYSEKTLVCRSTNWLRHSRLSVCSRSFMRGACLAHHPASTASLLPSSLWSSPPKFLYHLPTCQVPSCFRAFEPVHLSAQNSLLLLPLTWRIPTQPEVLLGCSLLQEAFAHPPTGLCTVPNAACVPLPDPPAPACGGKTAWLAARGAYWEGSWLRTGTVRVTPHLFVRFTECPFKCQALF